MNFLYWRMVILDSCPKNVVTLLKIWKLFELKPIWMCPDLTISYTFVTGKYFSFHCRILVFFSNLHKTSSLWTVNWWIGKLICIPSYFLSRTEEIREHYPYLLSRVSWCWSVRSSHNKVFTAALNRHTMRSLYRLTNVPVKWSSLTIYRNCILPPVI